jgi:hypothetical protein
MHASFRDVFFRLVLISLVAAACGGQSTTNGTRRGNGNGGGDDDDPRGGSGTGASSSRGGTTGTGASGNAAGKAAGGTSGGVDWPVACENFEVTYCEALRACGSDSLDATFCEDRIESWCLAPDRVVDGPDAQQRCTDAVARLTCDELLVTLIEDIPECRLRGSRENGSACTTHDQCETGFCTNDDDDDGGGACLRCRTPREEGESCDLPTDCALGTMCWNERCQKSRDLGEPCSAEGFCGFNMRCADGICSPMPRLGEPCFQGIMCDYFNFAIWCDTDLGICVAEGGPAAGEPCSRDGYCAPGALCTGGGICRAHHGQGESCNPDVPCTPYLSCEDGICQRPPPACH